MDAFSFRTNLQMWDRLLEVILWHGLINHVLAISRFAAYRTIRVIIQLNDKKLFVFISKIVNLSDDQSSDQDKIVTFTTDAIRKIIYIKLFLAFAKIACRKSRNFSNNIFEIFN